MYRVALVLLATVAWPSAVLADGAPPAAVRAFDVHAEAAIAAFARRASRPVADGDARALSALRRGDIIAGPGSGDGILDVEGGLIHHWKAQALLPGLTLDRVLGASKAYETYPKVFHPIVASQVLRHDGDDYTVQFRLRSSAAGLSATLDMRSAIHHTRLDARHAFVVSRSEEVREVRDAGKPSERLLPEGEGSGYLWRACTLTRFVEDDAGVWMEMETLGLSRPFPRMLGWLIEPIARRIGRRSAEDSEDDFRTSLPVRGTSRSIPRTDRRDNSGAR